MSAEIRVPTLGESIVDATIASWLKKEGDAVKRGDTLVELETDKVNVEVSAEQDGILQKVIKQVGDTVAVGEVLGVIEEGAATGASDGTTSKGSTKEKTGSLSNGAAATNRVSSVESRPQQTSQVVTHTGPLPAVRSGPLEPQRPPSPLARRVAAEYNVDISQVKGSNPHGRVTREDVLQYLEQNVQKTPPQGEVPVDATQPMQAVQTQRAAETIAAPLPIPSASNSREERVRMTRRRQTIAQRLVEAQHTAAMLTTFNEIDMSAIMEVRARRKESFKERHNVSLGFMSFFTKAVVGALKAFPRLNAEIQGNEMVIKHYYDIGIAVGSEEGLVVPVMREADRKGFADIEREIADLAKRAREGKLSLPELQGGTFTITNGGVYGSLLSTPILNSPQVGILGMHKIEQRPIALNGQVVIRSMMYVALSYDHRIVDGSEAVRFLVKVKELVEDPETLLLEG
ncbi:MAG: 2-oxoglutarate dehydrogenase complex dihydrolipoyllysine-residue succinyltransferase [Ktedonobacteraceae bacterium]|nr:2-oxoglutarate dehydrogenase complex dihydrolipoyllysine-residue succinyltransferase [Ktedonobacteraceae bacterium]